MNRCQTCSEVNIDCPPLLFFQLLSLQFKHYVRVITTPAEAEVLFLTHRGRNSAVTSCDTDVALTSIIAPLSSTRRYCIVAPLCD